MSDPPAEHHSAAATPDHAGDDTIRSAAYDLELDHLGVLDLLRVSQMVTGDLDLKRTLHHLLEAARTLARASFAALGVLDDHGEIAQFLHHGMRAELVDTIREPLEGRGLLDAVLRGEVIRLANLWDDPRSTEAPGSHPGVQAFLGVPITIHDRTYGALCLTNPANQPFTSDDERLITALAGTAATAINNARLYNQAQRARELHATLSQATTRLLGVKDAEIFGVLAESVAALLGAQLALVVVSETAGESFYVETARGEHAADIQGSSIPWKDSVLSRAMEGESGISPLQGTEPIPFAEDLAHASVVAVPLEISGDRVAGLCAIRSAHHSPFTDDDLQLLEEFAKQADLAIALAWARADQQRREMIEERARIARDLHDHVIQKLFATGIELQGIASRDAKLAHALSPHVARIDSAITDIRAAIFALHHRGGDEELRHQLLEVITEISPSLGTVPRLSLTGILDRLIDDSLAEDLLAVLRESLTNVARHAQAQTVSIEVCVTDDEVMVTVDDDGVGVPDHSSRSRGIHNLDDRARARGGDFTLSPGDPGGTRLRWRAPLNAQMPP